MINYEMSIKIVVIAICAVTFIFLDVIGQNAVVVDTYTANLEDHMEVLVLYDEYDNIDSMDIPNADFKPYSLGLINNKANVYWVRFAIDNPMPYMQELLVSTFYFDSVRVFRAIEDSLILLPGKNGYLVPPEERAFVHDHTSLVPIFVESGTQQTYYFQIFSLSKGAKNISKTSFRIGFYAYTAKGFKLYHHYPLYFHLFMLGALLLVAIYNTGIFIALRNRAFFYLALYNTAAIFWVISFGGFYITLFGIEDLALERTVRQASSFPPLMMSYMLLTINFLYLKNHSRVLYSVQLVCLIIAVIIFILYLNNYFSLGNFIGLMLLPVYYLMPSASAIVAIKKKVTGSVFFLVATLVMTIGIISLVCGYSLPTVNYIVGQYIYQFCLFCEVLIFSLAGTEVIMKEHREKQMLQTLREKDNADRKKQYALLTETLSQISDKNKEIDRIRAKFDEVQDSPISESAKKRQLHSLNTNEEWVIFKIYFNQLFTGFFNNLLQKHPDLTVNEQRLCSLVKIGLKNREIAAIQDISIKGVEKSKERLKKKLGIDKEISLNDYIMRIVN